VRPHIGATATKRRVATYAIDAEIRFATAADRAAFAEELGAAVKSLVGKYHASTRRAAARTGWSSPCTRA